MLELRWPWVEGEDASDQEGTSEGHAELELHQDLAGPVSNGAHQPRAPVLGGRGQYLLRTLYNTPLEGILCLCADRGADRRRPLRRCRYRIASQNGPFRGRHLLTLLANLTQSDPPRGLPGRNGLRGAEARRKAERRRLPISRVRLAGPL